MPSCSYKYPLGGVNNSHSETVKCYRRVVQYHRQGQGTPHSGFQAPDKCSETASVLDTDPGEPPPYLSGYLSGVYRCDDQNADSDLI